MEIVIDFNPLIEAASFGPFYFFWFFLSNGGWLIIGIICIWFFLHLWLETKRANFLAKQEYCLLAIDVPKENEQSLKAVEYIFSSLHSTRSKGTLYERYWLGRVPLGFSFEIVSIEGYIQYLIRAPTNFRNLVEAAVYSQYPEAEITEIEDYIRMIPTNVGQPDCDYKLFGTEFVQEKPALYPLRVYVQFEHSFAQVFADPLAGLLEVFSQLKKGEIAAYQLVVRPTADDWKAVGTALVKKLIGAKVEAKKNLADKAVDQLLGTLGWLSEQIYSLWGGIKEEKKKDSEYPSKMLYLSPGERSTVEAIENKMARLGCKVKMRVIYLAHKDLYSKARGITVTLSSIKQFNADNALKVYKKLFTLAEYFFIEQRVNYKRRRLIRFFKERNTLKLGKPMILNTEELATMWHFPTIGVKTALIKTIESKKAEAPVTTPFAEEQPTVFFQQPTLAEEAAAVTEKEKEEKIEYLPAELLNYDFSNKYFEEKFTTDKTKIKTPEQTTSSTKSGPPANLPIVE